MNEESLRNLKDDVQSLNKRISRLENILHVENQPEYVKNTQKASEKMAPKVGMEEAIGFQWFSRIGILALVLGVVFFLKYAFDNDLINHLARIVIGVVAGLALVVGGELTARNEKYKQWAKKLVAGGFAITYFTVFAAYNLPEYRDAIGITLSQDIILLSLVVVGGIILGLKDDSKTFVGAAFLLGFVTAFMGGQSGNLTPIYALFLTILLVIVSIYKQWHSLGVGGIAATYLIFGYWAVDTNPSFNVAIIFLSSYFVAFLIQAFLFKEKLASISIAALLNSLFFYVYFYNLLGKFDYTAFQGLFTWGMAVSSFCLYLGAKVLKKDLLRFVYLALAILFLTIAIHIELNGQWITIAWALEATILGYIGVELDVPLVRYASYIVAFLAFQKAFFRDMQFLSGYEKMAAVLVPVASFYATGIYSGLKKIVVGDSEKLFFKANNFYATILAASLISAEFSRFYISIGWAVLALVITALGFALKQKSLRAPGILLFALTIIKVFVYDTSELSTFGRMVSFLALGVILLLVSFGYNKYKDKLKDVL